MRPIGRNDPCPGGSGKKYKKCCLNETKVFSTEEFHYQRLSEAYNQIFDKMAEFCGRVLGPEAEDRVLSEYWMAAGRDLVPEELDLKRQMPLFAPWMVFNWEVTLSASANKLPAFQGKTVAEILLQDPFPRLDSLERRVAEAANRNP